MKRQIDVKVTFVEYTLAIWMLYLLAKEFCITETTWLSDAC